MGKDNEEEENEKEDEGEDGPEQEEIDALLAEHGHAVKGGCVVEEADIRETLVNLNWKITTPVA